MFVLCGHKGSARVCVMSFCLPWNNMAIQVGRFHSSYFACLCAVFFFRILTLVLFILEVNFRFL